MQTILVIHQSDITFYFRDSSSRCPTLLLYAAEPLHAGLVILIPVVGRVLQQRLFNAALEELAVIGEPNNRVLEIDLDGAEVTLTLYDLPSTQTALWKSSLGPYTHLNRSMPD